MVESFGGRGLVAAEVVVVNNLEEFAIPRLSIEINGRFLLFRDPPLEALEELVLPQEVFTDTKSNQQFDPRVFEVEDIVVTHLVRGESSKKSFLSLEERAFES